jgi:hypothetical protein
LRLRSGYDTTRVSGVNRSLRPLATLLLLLACGPEPKPGSPLFRHVTTARGEIRLGEVWDATWVPGIDPGALVIALPSGTFGGAQAIRVTRGPDRVVRELTFDYDQGTDFAAQLAEYEVSLGPPTVHRAPADPESAEVVTWTDAVTSFELIRDPRRSASTVYSRLMDRAGAR